MRKNIHFTGSKMEPVTKTGYSDSLFTHLLGDQ